jgi:WXG100 family type VII secretion target
VPTIHVNTDLMRNLGVIFNQLNDQIQNQIQPAILSNTTQLESDWVGVSRATFEQLLGTWRAAAVQLIQSGEDLGHHLQNTATTFEQADKS